MKKILIKSKFLIFSVCILIVFFFKDSPAQNELSTLKDKGYLALYQAITDLMSDFTLMSVAAHPDDEDIETLTYYRRKEGVKTVVVVATRGEGGQNEIGPELYRDLGVIRTYEMWRAGTISGTEYYNMNLEEFGYSKSAKEAFEKWGHQEPLRRLVQLIRKIRPNVIITNHDTHSGHGHHQALGILIREAFDLAGDPAKFPEQLTEGLTVWQPSRLFQRVGNSDDADISVHVGDFDPVRGESYAQIAARALSEHRSQGMEFFAKSIKRGPRFRYYKLIKSVDSPIPTGSDNIFAGLPDFYDKLKSEYKNSKDRKLLQLKKARQQTISKFYKNPSALRFALLEELTLWRKFHDDLEENSQLLDIINEQEKELEIAIYRTLSLDFNLHPSDVKVIRGQNLQIRAVLFNGGNKEVVLKSVKLISKNHWLGDIKTFVFEEPGKKLSYNQSDTTVFELVIPDTAKFTVPKTVVFYQTDHWEPLLKSIVEYEYQGSNLHAWAEADFDIVPELDLELRPSKTIIPLSFRGKSKDFFVQIKNNSLDPIRGEIHLRWFGSSPLNNMRILTQSFALEREEEETAVKFRVPIPLKFDQRDYPVKIIAHLSNRNNNDYLQIEGLIRGVNVKTYPGLRVGIVKSYDNTLQNALNQLGIQNQLLRSEDLQWSDLSQFDTIILDIRAYLVREDLRKNNARILEYVKKGGNLIVMYQKVFEWNPEYGNPQWSPYLLLLSHERVTYENAPIHILDNNHPLLNSPNKITTSDWEGWIQERGLYFPSEWDSRFKPLLSMSDPGENPLLGSYLVAKYGKGNYIYTSLVWYRQLRASVPGSFRNLANMVGFAYSMKENL